ncbi:hypothetical protein CAPTEDRAFT_224781 [Capitella teleta]|uniref:SUEL-type lectin domain-containing protein n=1 Tax=Capitella teleta TaxID=283909 RepID=R7UUN3_CAPTE|nr:hypothetical protein CAPTEDRAFT_224781 [Capitella teleta]|eukprot:ELU10353.1 hypothetical protein CAPTEDRAFT_224781 [Capitella teleta]
MDLSAIMLDTVCFSLFICYTHAFQVTTVQTCSDEVFQARCLFSQKILVTQCRYGHIEVSRCVDDIFASLGSLGCYVNVTELVGAKCNGKYRCDIPWNDPEIVATQSCKKGLPMYIDTSYVCIPDTYDVQDCGTISVNRQMHYLLSKDVWDHHCFYDLEQKVNVDFSAEPNLKIKMYVQDISDTQAVTNDGEIYVTYDDGERLSLHEESSEIESSHLTLTFTNKHVIKLIGFQATGCDDMAAPVYAWVSREGDMATVGCYHSEYEWKMSCIGSKWIGPRSNCTDKKQDIIKSISTPETTAPYAKNTHFLTTDILFALIIGLTVLLCAIVITIGYVCLKRSKYTYEAKSAPYEMATMMSDPSNTATWQKAKLQGNNDTLILPVNSLQGQTLQLR